MTENATGTGTKDDPWQLRTPPGSSEYTMYRDETADPPALVCQVGKTQLRYHLRAIDDLHAMLKAQGDWVPLGGADEQKPAAGGHGRGVGTGRGQPGRRLVRPEEGPPRPLRRLPAAAARGTRPGRADPRRAQQPDAGSALVRQQAAGGRQRRGTRRESSTAPVGRGFVPSALSKRLQEGVGLLEVAGATLSLAQLQAIAAPERGKLISSMAEIEFSDVQKVYDDGTQAVFDLNLAIRDGELMVLVGPSGCGKTTALRMVAGLEEITDGEVRIGDQIVNDLTPKERNIAMVFQSYALYPHMTVEENLAFSLKLHKLPKEEVKERVQRAASILQIEDFLKRKPRALSGGQRQRVAMGRAIVREPEAFLMDEPLSNLDAKLRVQMRAEIHQLQRRLDVTTIYVTHDQVEAMTMGDRVAVMNAGRLQQVDTPQALYDSR